ncbi:FAD-dependent oxidoreductase [Streptomyces sp. NPDC054933]
MACDAVVIGAGPIGLAAALDLGRLGAEVLLVERRTELARLPKAMAVSARSMELLRQWGCDRALRARGLPPWRSRNIDWRTSVANGRHIVSLPQLGDAADVQSALGTSPQTWLNVPQYAVEEVLHDAVGRLPNVRFWQGVEAVVEEQDDRGVRVRLDRSADGGGLRRQWARARYALAADGSRALTRRRLGVGAGGDGVLGTALSIAFHADLAALGQLENAFYWVANARLVGMVTLVSPDFAVLNVLAPPARMETSAPTPPREQLVELVRVALGVPDLEVSVEAAERWKIVHDVADTYRRERVFFVGDSAHRFPPTGGLGLNTGLAEAHNLTWKLDAVMCGWAAEELLDSYERERRPLALATSRMAVRHFRSMLAVLERVGQLPGRVESDGRRGREFRRTLAGLVARTGRNYSADSVTFGYAYPAGALVADEEEELAHQWPLDRYVPHTHAGVRAPHVWLLLDGRPVSSLDLFQGRFTLLTGPQGHTWVRAARRASASCGVPLAAFAVGGGGPLEDPCGRWTVVYGVGPADAVLVRPDGHVAWRKRVSAAGADEEALLRLLVSVLNQVTCTSGPEPARGSKDAPSAQDWLDLPPEG